MLAGQFITDLVYDKLQIHEVQIASDADYEGPLTPLKPVNWTCWSGRMLQQAVLVSWNVLE